MPRRHTKREKTMSNISRRKFINISGVALGMCLLSDNLMASQKKISWKGVSLGAQADISLYHEDASYAKKTIQECVIEVRRLERIFSLFYSDSSIVELNKNSQIIHPPKELVELLLSARKISYVSLGAFDVTVQPLWVLYASHFAKKNANPNGPSLKKIKKVKANIGWEKIHINKEKIQFEHKDMAITLNGIAQGYITDKITELLRQKGFSNLLVDLGEVRALGNHPDGRSWKIAVPHSQEISKGQGFLELENQAIASSGGYGTEFKPGYHHLFNPKNGTSANYIKAVSIKAPTATLADALSTTVAVMSIDKSKELLRLYPDVTAYIS